MPKLCFDTHLDIHMCLYTTSIQDAVIILQALGNIHPLTSSGCCRKYCSSSSLLALLMLDSTS